MLLKILTHNFDTIHLGIGLFFSIVLYDVINIGYHIKRILKMDFTKALKPFDCFQCMTFWTTLITTQSIMSSMVLFTFIYMIDYVRKSN